MRNHENRDRTTGLACLVKAHEVGMGIVAMKMIGAASDGDMADVKALRAVSLQ